MTQVGAPAVGEVLADRYRLEEHIDDDATGRQVWRGVDVILRRPVTIVLKYPGGADAEDMLNAAVAASRVIHPHTVGVYDAVDEGERAYVVREFVDARALRDVVATRGPLDARRATAVAHAIADALAAVHATGVAHGNVHAGTVLLGADDRIVLADARAGNDASQESDIRGLGTVLYAALTGHSPDPDGDDALPPAPRPDGKLPAPRQVRANVPNYLDALTMDLLDEALPAPAAAELSAELGRLDVANEVSGPLDLVTVEPPEQHTSRPIWKKLAVGIAALAAISLVGLLIGTKWVNNAGNASPNGEGSPSATAAASQPKLIKPKAVRVIDPKGNGTEYDGVDQAVDKSPTTGWSPDNYTSADFGGIKDGMGILLDLGSERSIATVQVKFSDPGATAGLKMGTSDPGNGNSANQTDGQLVSSFKTVPGAEQSEVTVNKIWTPSDVKTRYLLVWITKLPETDNQPGNPYGIQVNDIKVRGQ